MKTSLLIVGGLLLAGGGWYWLANREPARSQTGGGPAPAAEITYVCLETGSLSRGPRVETPAINPALGRATLVQALYCERCQGWHRMPPREVLDRMPLGPVCPKTRAPLRETAPAHAPLEMAR